MIDEHGVKRLYMGGWILVDGGYVKVGCFIDPPKLRLRRDEVLWSEWLESVRKDVECAFGVIKSRFRYLWGSVVAQDEEIIEWAMKTACILHNLILEFDGRTLKDWQSVDWQPMGAEEKQDGDMRPEDWEDINWETLDPNGEQDGDYVHGYKQTDDPNGEKVVEKVQYINVDNQRERELRGKQARDAELQNISDIEADARRRVDGIRESTNNIGPNDTPLHGPIHITRIAPDLQSSYYELKSKLQTNFTQSWRRGLVFWPKTATKDRRSEKPIPDVDRRARIQYFACLYKDPSTLRIRSPDGKVGESLGEGLFSRLNYTRGETIAYFNGVLIGLSDYKKEEEEGRGGFGIRLDAVTVMNCYQKFKDGKCMASFAKSPEGCVERTRYGVQIALANAELVVNRRFKTARLVCIVEDLPAHEEIMYTYQHF
jgi:hypothetical protein